MKPIRCETCGDVITPDDYREHDSDDMRQSLERWCRGCVLGIEPAATAITEEEVESWQS